MSFSLLFRRPPALVQFAAFVLAGSLLAGCGGIQISTDDEPSGDAAEPQTQQAGGQQAGGQQAGGQQAGGQQANENGGDDGLKPFSEAVSSDAKTDEGLITAHRADDKLYFEIPDSLIGRGILSVSRVAKTQADLFGRFGGGGKRVNSQVLRWERRGEELLLRVVSHKKTADPGDPVYTAVQNSSFEPILKSFDIEAMGRDSTGVVIDATPLFTSDVRAFGIPQEQQEEHGIRRLDGDRTYLTGVESFPKNTDVEAVLTYQANDPPSSGSSGTVSVEMNHSLVLLPEEPMQPRHCDRRVGYYDVERVNYSSDEQQAAEECFVTRWRLEPSDREAYANGKLVEPKEPIVYYVGPATPEKWRPYIRKGIEDWQKAFRNAGFENAIQARMPSETDSTFDPDDIRYSTVRWVASESQNARGLSVQDPRSGEILEADARIFHNIQRSLRDRLFVQTAAANPEVRGQSIDPDLMGRGIRQVTAHEIGHTLGLPHNMAASNAVPVDSLRSSSYTSTRGTSPSIMDYARFNYVAQPGDGIEQFATKIGAYDEWTIRWGYQRLPSAEDQEKRARRLDEMTREKAGDPTYFYGRQNYFRVLDPRSQREDLGRDAVKAGSLGVANLQRIVPNLINWTRQEGSSYDELESLYGEVVRQWQRYLGHAARHVGGMRETFRTYDQASRVYEPVSAERQRRAMQFVIEQGLQAPEWLVEAGVLRRIEATGALNRIREAQVGTVELLLQPERLARLIETNAVDTKGEGTERDTYSPSAMLADLREGVWSELSSGEAIGPYRRNLQRGYLRRMQELLSGEAELDLPPRLEDLAVVKPADADQSDIQALVRGELRVLRSEVEQALRRGPDEMTERHLRDVLTRIEDIRDESE